MLDAKKIIKKKNNSTCQHLGLTCIFELFFALLCVPVFAVCTKWTCSLWTGDALTLTPRSYCARKLFKITLLLLWVCLHTFPYHHLLSDCSLITRNYIWMERVDLSEKLTLILICQGGKMGYLHFKKDFVVFCCGILAAVRQWTYKSPDSWVFWSAEIVSKSYVFYNIPTALLPPSSTISLQSCFYVISHLLIFLALSFIRILSSFHPASWLT